MGEGDVCDSDSGRWEGAACWCRRRRGGLVPDGAPGHCGIGTAGHWTRGLVEGHCSSTDCGRVGEVSVDFPSLLASHRSSEPPGGRQQRRGGNSSRRLGPTVPARALHVWIGFNHGQRCSFSSGKSQILTLAAHLGCRICCTPWSVSQLPLQLT
ncbi:hypothetical protein BDV59DRAFT_168401 [Aspergillus ambiguus]|uniref:uncharacterized protein n=1 Tax=Aspergillus ambiguus TaxID=176160 RepID=UPI003CCE3701